VRGDRPHISVLAGSIGEAFAGVHLRHFVDGTCGAGGHSRLVALQHPELERLIALDKDREALAIAKETLEQWRELVTYVHSDYRDLESVLESEGLATVDGVLLDLGVSSMQLDTPSRGFSFQHDGPLDMRMDQSSGLSAADIVNTWSEEELTQLFRMGEERCAKKCARAIVERRSVRPFSTTLDLAEVVRPHAFKRGKIHPATRLFQALRIEVNGELEGLKEVLGQIANCLSPGGRAAIISFHSLEDRLVKHFIKERAAKRAYGEVRNVDIIEITRKPITASEEEVRQNPRARSAKLRVFEKI